MPPPCPFCSVPPERVVLDDGPVFAMRDAFPVSPGHTLVIPRRHVGTWFHATVEEQHATTAAIARNWRLITITMLAAATWDCAGTCAARG